MFELNKFLEYSFPNSNILGNDFFVHGTDGKIDFFKIEDDKNLFLDSLFINENILNPLIDENLFNEKRVRILDEKYTKLIINLLKTEEIEYGRISQAEKLVKEQMLLNSIATLNWINDLYIKNFKDEAILIGILRLIANFDEEIISPTGQTIALASLSHKNIEVREFAVKAFENWVSERTLNILTETKVSEVWLQEYIDQVINDIKDFLCLS